MMTLPLEMTRGDSFKKTLTFTDSNDAAVDISEWTIFFTVKKVEYDSTTDDDAVMKTTDLIGIGEGTSGIMTITVAASDTINIDPDVYKYDIQIKKADGTIRTVMKGSFTILSDITRRIT